MAFWYKGVVALLVAALFTSCQTDTHTIASLSKLNRVSSVQTSEDEILLFSDYGFNVFNLAVGGALELVYDENNKLSIQRVESVFKDWEVQIDGEYIRISNESASVFSFAVLANEKLVALDPKLNELVLNVTASSVRNRPLIPQIPIDVNRL